MIFVGTQAALGSRQDLLKWLSTLNKNGDPKTVATPSHARRVFHRVMEEVKNIACSTQNLNYLKQVVFDPMPQNRTAAWAVGSWAAGSFHANTIATNGCKNSVLLGQRYERAHTGPFSEATKHAIRQCQLPIDISDLPFYGYGIHDRNDVVKFFLGANGSRWHQNVTKESVASLSALQTRFATIGSGLQKLLVDITNELCKMRLFTLVILVQKVRKSLPLDQLNHSGLHTALGSYPEVLLLGHGCLECLWSCAR